MVEPERKPVCPRCGCRRVTLCGYSVQYRPESRPDQPLQEREIQTLAFRCECGLAFTDTGNSSSLRLGE